VPAVRLGQDGERRGHPINITRYAYNCQRIRNNSYLKAPKHAMMGTG
jgi:hypothetical protein